jgi:trans-aconitate methyltransferase
MDFGCGTGISLPLLEDILHPEQIIGLDPSEKSLAVARELARSLSVQLATPRQVPSTTDSRLGFLQWRVPSHTVGGAICSDQLHLSLFAARRYVRTMGK